MEVEKERGMEGEKERGKMEGEKEREREQGEEKESDEAEEEYEEDQEDEEEEEEDPEGAAQLWQEGQQDADVDELGLPIMHWEALSLRIAELEKQEEEKKKNAKQHSNSSLERGSCLERGRTPVSWMDDRDRGRSQRDVTATCWEDPEDDCNSRVSALTSRLGTHMNLQLCFINNSESEEDEEDEDDNKKKAVKRGTVQVPHPPQTAPAVAERTKPSRSFKNALRSLRDRLRTDHKQQVPPVVTRRRTLERQDLVAFSIKELNALCGSLSQAIQELSTDLVGRLQTRDQLRTEQDAMLVEVQDLTSL